MKKYLLYDDFQQVPRLQWPIRDHEEGQSTLFWGDKGFKLVLNFGLGGHLLIFYYRDTNGKKKYIFQIRTKHQRANAVSQSGPMHYYDWGAPPLGHGQL